MEYPSVIFALSSCDGNGSKSNAGNKNRNALVIVDILTMKYD